ncbi:MAG TPA: CehA/McbA family metallohydrolase [Phycisphaerae bacterium]|nr:CehA/McbA family metallohydrolase [Phycisphaerae bacterium]
MTRTAWILLLIAPMTALLAGCASHRPVTHRPSVSAQADLPRHYVCPKATGPIVIDGHLDDPAWASAPWTDPFVDIEGDDKPQPRHHTRAKMTWDDDYLYIAAALDEPHVWATLTRRDQIVFRDNDFEVFIDPDGDAREYYEIEINPLNTIFDLLLMRTYTDGGPALHDWNLEGLKTAVHVDGTLNDTSDVDRGWSVEFALPWSSLAEYAHRPTPPRDGDTWRMNFSRVEWQHDIIAGRYQKLPDTPEDNWVWSPQGRIDMHVPQHWGYVQFSQRSSAAGAAASAEPGKPPGHDAARSGVIPAPTAGNEAPVAILDYSILDENGQPIPGRLTFLGELGAPETLFPNTQAAPNELAVRQDVIFTLSGRGSITVPPGTYTVYASRGLEWSIDSREVTLQPGERAEFTARLRREVDTTGWICGDFHLHTAPYSSDGTTTLNERIITFLGVGLEFAVATDHNHNTDYHPTMRELGVTDRLTATTGNEVSTPIGHFNAFPLDPTRPILPSKPRDATELFSLIRQETNPSGIVPVIQVNHPRWGSIAHFGKTILDPVTGVAHSQIHSDDFDSIEIFNENAGWGYYDAEIVRDLETGAGRHSVLRDWFNLLNRGHRYAAVGNSDSHTVRRNFAGYPRNYVASSTDDPGRIDVAEVAGAIRGRRVFTTIGPFAEYWVNGVPMGGDATATQGRVELKVKVQAASWVDCDRVRIVVNGDVVRELPVPDTRQALRLDTTVDLQVPRDSWLALLIEGDDSLAPIVHDSDRPILPLAVMNPVWIDADGDGRWTSPWEQAELLVAEHAGDALFQAAWSDRLPSERGLTVLAAAERRHPATVELIRRGLTDGERVVRLLSARAAETLGESALTADLLETYARHDDDPYFQVALLRACNTCAADRFAKMAFEFIDRRGASVARRYGQELLGRLPSQIVRDWQVVGYFPNPDKRTLVTADYGPETADVTAPSFTGKNGLAVAWQPLLADESGYLDLGRIDRDPNLHTNAIAYAQTWLHAPEDRSVYFALGSDDGCRMWLNGDLLHEDNTRHSADPFRHLGRLPLRAGWNRVLLKVENGTGDFGLYFRVLDNEIRTAAEPAK